jgi:hypothetical protein
VLQSAANAKSGFYIPFTTIVSECFYVCRAQALFSFVTLNSAVFICKLFKNNSLFP